MLLPQTKEREYRFKLALRMGVPLFFSTLLLISNTLLNHCEILSATFYFEAILLLVFSIYYILYIIYSGFDIRITDKVTNTFTREYLYRCLKKEILKKKDYTIILITVDNLYEINDFYGIKNGDKVLSNATRWVCEYLNNQNISDFPIGTIKGGDFIIGLKGKKEDYNTMFELMFLKANEFIVDDIEVKFSFSITDTTYSNKLDYLVENLYDIQKNKFQAKKDENLNPNELELSVIEAIKNRSFNITMQDVFEKDKSVIKECFIKLKITNDKLLFPKTFMKVINRLGLSVNYDLMVVEKVILHYNSINEIIAIPISPTSLRNYEFLSKIKTMLKEYNSCKMMFIIYEQEFYSNINRYNMILKSLRDLGVLIAVDRLGSVHTSFLYLRDLDIDIVRFDSYYTKDLSLQNNGIINSFNTMAHSLGVKTWVKMIENKNDKNILEDMGIDYIQGKYLAPLEINN
ncbi:MAG: GGDEF domain-containing protein [Campylobacterota bacterium]|nr:GGDEF domain-containing protein [Campylobacterota bacterium]